MEEMSALGKPAVLLITWKRPECVKEMLKVLRIAKPERLYVFSDGARESSEKVELVRSTIHNNINWECKLTTKYEDINHGCSAGPILAVNWFFEFEEEGIILEEDCIPSEGFFVFCAQLLERYRNDTRIWSICGSNPHGPILSSKADYYFSRFPRVWGWATWKGRWDRYDRKISLWPTLKEEANQLGVFRTSLERRYWSYYWDKTSNMAEHNLTWWDYQWSFCSIVNGGLSIISSYNLVSNIGCGDEATHTKTLRPVPLSNAMVKELKHPDHIIPSAKGDLMHIRNAISGSTTNVILFYLKFFLWSLRYLGNKYFVAIPEEKTTPPADLLSDTND